MRSSDHSDALIGQTVAHYDILAKLGEGGMGMVYRARDTRLDRDVALKILGDDVAGNYEYRQRFEREIKAIAALNHPNIVTIHAVEEAHGRLFYSMEVVDGITLDEFMYRKSMTLPRLFEIVLPLVDAVEYAHSQGITHRDLKPGNVLIDKEGRVKVLDFGLAKLKTLGGDDEDKTIRFDDSITGEGRVIGTAAYMSPEQAEGKPIDHRTDIFSLGIVLYQMTTGRRPFSGDTPVSTFSSILRDTPTSITELNHSLPRHLGRIVKRCLAKDPNRRYQTARDLHNDLLDLKDEIDSGESELPEYPMTQGRRRTQVWQLAVVATLVVAVIALAAWRLLPGVGGGGDAPPGPAAVLDITPVTRSGDVTQASLSPDGKYLAYVRGVDGSRSLRLKQIVTGTDVEIVPAGESSLADPTISPSGDFIYYHASDPEGGIYRIPLLGGRARRVVPDARSRFGVSPDGRTIAYNVWSDMHRDVMLRDTESGEDRPLIRYSILTSHEISYSPDGSEVATSKISPEGIGEIVMAVPADGGPERVLCRETWNNVSGFCWLPTGGGVMIAGAQGLTKYLDPVQIWYQPGDGRPLQKLTRDLDSYGSLSMDRQGQLMAAVQTQSRTAVCMAPLATPDDVREVVQTSNAGHHWNQVSWTPDGRILYHNPLGGALHVWDANPDGTDMQRITSGDGVNMAIEVSRDGRRVVYFSDRSGSTRIWISDRDGGNARLLAEGGCDELWPQFTPDGEWVYYLAYFSADNVFEWRRVPAAGGASAKISEMFAYDWAFSPDGTRLAVASLDPVDGRKLLHIMTADLAETLASYEWNYAWPSIVRWTPDGSGIAYTVSSGDTRNIWVWPAEGGEARQLTHRTGGQVLGFDFSPDGQSLGYSWIESTSDAVLLRNFQGGSR